MCRSSRFPAFATVALLMAGPAMAQGAQMAGGAAPSGPGVAGQPVGPVFGGGRGARGGGLGGGHPRRFPQSVIGGGLGISELNSGLPNPDFAPYPADPTPVEADGPRFDPPPPGFIPAPPPCVAPQIIRVGRGITHRPKTRVIYGLPPCGPFD